MHAHLSEISVDAMFSDYMYNMVDPPDHVLDCFYYDGTVCKVTKEWMLSPKMCQMVQSVTLYARVGPSIFARDISNWEVKEDDSGERDNKAGEDTKRGKDTKRGTRPDCGIFFDNDRSRSVVVIPPETFMANSRIKDEDKAIRKDWVGCRSWSDIVVPIEAKINHPGSAFEFNKPTTRFLRNDTQGGREALGQIAEYSAKVFGHQHRTHLYALYVYRGQARILYLDRAGGVVSKPFSYGTRQNPGLHRFIWRLARMSSEQLGFDPSVTLASEADISKMRAYAASAPTPYIGEKLHAALSMQPTTQRVEVVDEETRTNSEEAVVTEKDVGMSGAKPKVPRAFQWPIYQVTIGDTKVLIGRPAFSSGSLFGRCTRGYVAYDVDNNASRFLKDSWRVDRDRIDPEHRVYDRLEREGVGNVLTCVCGEDVPGAEGNWQLTRCQKPGVCARGHYRILLEQVCRPLTDFSNFKELVQLLSDAMYAHKDAWENAGVLHRDVSVNNILIYEELDGGEIVRAGYLSDWDLCKYKEHMAGSMEPRQPDHTGTWYFRSAASLRWPRKPYELSDDIESFVHVCHYCILQFHVTVQTRMLSTFFGLMYEEEEIRQVDGAHVGGGQKFVMMSTSDSTIRMDSSKKTNEILDDLLQEIATLCATHYSTINAKSYSQLYDPSQPQMPEGSNTGPASYRRRPARPQKKHTAVALRRAVQATAPQSTPTLRDHGPLLDLFLRYGDGVEGETPVEWPDESLKKSEEDLFEDAKLLPRKDSAWSSSSVSRESNERAIKKRKANNGSALVSVVESTEITE